MDQNTATAPQDVNDEALKDMTMTSEGAMEETAEVTNTNAPEPPQSVMDVTAPPQDVVVAAPEPVAEEPEVAAEAPSSYSSESMAAESPAEVQVVMPTGSDPVMAADTHNKKTGKGLIVAIAVVLALVLATIAVLVFIKANDTAKSADKSSSTASNQAQSTESTTKTPLTTADVNTVASELDTTLGALDENKDFSADALSDKTLGLQ